MYMSSVFCSNVKTPLLNIALKGHTVEIGAAVKSEDNMEKDAIQVLARLMQFKKQQQNENTENVIPTVQQTQYICLNCGNGFETIQGCYGHQRVHSK